MNRWSLNRLGEILDIHDHKRIPISSRERVKRKGKFPYYGASGIIDHIDDYIFDGEYLIISEDGENLRSRKTPIAFKVTGKFWVNNHAHIVSGKYPGISDYVRYYLSNLDLNPFITGAVQPKLSQANLINIPISLPDKNSL